MIRTMTCYQAVCDGCGEVYDFGDYVALGSRKEVLEGMDYDDVWAVIDDKITCPPCLPVIASKTPTLVARSSYGRGFWAVISKSEFNQLTCRWTTSYRLLTASIDTIFSSDHESLADAIEEVS